MTKAIYEMQQQIWQNFEKILGVELYIPTHKENHKPCPGHKHTEKCICEGRKYLRRIN